MAAYVIITIFCMFVLFYAIVVYAFNQGVQKGKFEAKLEQYKNNADLNNEISTKLNDSINNGAELLINELRKNS